ncbi:MAG: hypothetical protein GXW93_12710 [Pseudomonas lactis]|nr:hypothetical protein [Pseudomonas lactis]
MFQTNPEQAINIALPRNEDQFVWSCMSHQLGMPWFYAREYLAAPNSLANPSSQMIMTSSIEDLDATLSGKIKGRSIKKIQLITNSFSESPRMPDIQLGLVTRIIRFSNCWNEASKYFIESTEGIVLEGPLDGSWGSCEQNVLMDVLDSVSDLGLAPDERWSVRQVQMKVVIQAIDLFKEDVRACSEWWGCKDPRLDGKAPKDLTTGGDYELLANLIREYHHGVFP